MCTSGDKIFVSDLNILDLRKISEINQKESHRIILNMSRINKTALPVAPDQDVMTLSSTFC